ncbi:MAG: hypothetical protein HY819_12655 [Acidobacteria bacterium]|nr:hypothetical protein [Acidobacteriota bacterium]
MGKTLVVAPRYQDLVRTLETYDLLPAIIFISSRRGCDESVESIKGNTLDDLPRSTRELILSTIEEFTPEDREFVSHHKLFYLLLYKGVAPHHAGHLPAWKHCVERLMSKGLLRAVFATTTLAAGIDMPARSVVITASSLRSDEGHRDLKAFELAQMTGRCGRRGKDNVGFSIFIPGPFQDINLILDLLAKPSEPIESQFFPNYTMVLNLLQQHSADTARALLERSFSQYQRTKKISDIRPRLERTLEKINKDKSGLPCLDRITTRQKFNELQEQALKARKSIKSIKRKIKHALATELEVEDTESLGKLEEKLEKTIVEIKALPCLTCSQVNICDGRVIVLQQQIQRSKDLEKSLYDLEHGLWEHFEECARLLQSFDYLNESWYPTSDGIWAANLRVENTLFMAELVRANYFATSDPRELAALVGALAASERQIEVEYQEGEESFLISFKNAVKIARTISKLQENVGLFFPIILDGDAARLLWRWADNNIDWEKLFEEVYADDGDVVRLILRTADLLRQLVSLQDAFPQLSDTASKAITLIRRPPIDD